VDFSRLSLCNTREIENLAINLREEKKRECLHEKEGQESKREERNNVLVIRTERERETG